MRDLLRVVRSSAHILVCSSLWPAPAVPDPDVRPGTHGGGGGGTAEEAGTSVAVGHFGGAGARERAACSARTAIGADVQDSGAREAARPAQDSTQPGSLRFRPTPNSPRPIPPHGRPNFRLSSILWNGPFSVAEEFNLSVAALPVPSGGTGAVSRSTVYGGCVRLDLRHHWPAMAPAARSAAQVVRHIACPFMGPSGPRRPEEEHCFFYRGRPVSPL